MSRPDFHSIVVVVLWFSWILGWYVIDANGLGTRWKIALTVGVVLAAALYERKELMRAWRKRRGP